MLLDKPTKDQVTTLTAGIVQAEIVEEKWDGQKYFLKAKIVADPNEVARAVRSLKDDYAKSKELENTRKKSDEALKEVERLKKELASAKDEFKKQERYNIAIKRLSSTSFFEKGNKLYFSWLFERNDRILEGAIEAYGKAIALNPEYAEAYKKRGICYSHMAREEGRFSEKYGLKQQQAIDDFKSAIGLNPTDPESYAEKGWAHYYLAEYQETSTWRETFRGNYEKAASDCAIAIGLYPLDTYPGLSMMDLIERMKTTKGDDGNKIKAVQLKYSYRSMYDCQGSADSKLGNYQKAIKSFSKYLEIHPKEAAKYELRGECYFYSGDYGKAIQDFTNVIEFTSKKDWIYIHPAYLKRAEAYMGLNDSEKAIKDYNKVIQEPSKYNHYVQQAYMGRGRVHLKLGNFKQAISDFDKVIELHPSHHIAFFDRGLAYYQLGNQEKAIDNMEIAACMDFKEAQEFLKSKRLWGKTPEEIVEICGRKIEEYRKMEGQGKTTREFVPVGK